MKLRKQSTYRIEDISEKEVNILIAALGKLRREKTPHPDVIVWEKGEKINYNMRLVESMYNDLIHFR